ncbi:hypothetical protein EMCRGX_G018139 [Ephydatia muelleri]
MPKGARSADLEENVLLKGKISASSAAAPSDRLVAVRIKRIKGEVTMMAKAACFPLSQLRTSTSTGQVWLKSGVRPLPDSTLTPHGHDGRTQQTCYTDVCDDTCFTGQGGGD